MIEHVQTKAQGYYQGFRARPQYQQHSILVGVATVVVGASLFLYWTNTGYGFTDTFVQKSWAGGTSTSLATKTGWTRFFSKDADFKAGTTVTLNETVGDLTDDTFAGGNNSQTDSTANDVKLGRSGGAAGIANLSNVDGDASDIKKDADGGLHVVYNEKNASAPYSRLYYLYSPNGGASWEPKIQINAPASGWPSGTPNYIGLDASLEIDTAAKRLYVAYKVQVGVNPNATYAGLVMGTCSYALSGGNQPCATNSANWSSTIVDGLSSNSQDRLERQYSSPTIVLTTDTTTTNQKMLHIATARQGSFHYQNCIVDASNCLVSDWSAVYAPNWWTTLHPRLVGGPGHRVHLVTILETSGQDTPRYRTCRITNSVNCISSGWASDIEIANSASEGRYIDATVFTSGASNGNSTYTLYALSSHENLAVYSTGSVTNGGNPSSFSHFSTISASSDLKPVRITQLSGGGLYTVFTRSGSLYTAFQQGGQICPPAPGATSSYVGWSCAAIEAGGKGAAMVLANNDPNAILPAITHFGGPSGTLLRFLATPFFQNGIFTSRNLDAQDVASWKQLQITLAESLKPGTSFRAFVRAGGTSSSPPTWSVNDPDTSFCQLFDTSVAGAPTPDGTNTYTVLFTSCSPLAVPENSRYLQYRIYLQSNASRNLTPVVDVVKAGYRRFPLTASLTSSPYQMVAQASDGPIVRSITWKEVIPSGSSARVSLQFRTKNSVSFGNDPWYGSGTNSGGAFISSGTSVDPACTRTNDTDPGALANGKKVTCNVEQANPANTTLNTHVQYKIALDSPDQTTAAVVYEVAITYATNDQPVVTLGTPTKASTGQITVPYTLSDSDSTFDVGLYYDIGLRLASNISQSDEIITLDHTGDLAPSSLIHSIGAVLIDNEQIKYTNIVGNTLRGVGGAPLVRGWVTPPNTNSNPAAHTAGAIVWVRATDPTIANALGKTSYASGDVGANQGKGSGKNIYWEPRLDIKAPVYVNDKTLRVAVNDGQLVKPVGGATITANFILDTKPPKFNASGTPVTITGSNVQSTNTGLKSSNTSVTLTVATLDGTADNATTANKLLVCNDISGSCGDPTISQIVGASPPSGWSRFNLPATTLSWTLTSQDAAQTVKIIAYDDSGNYSEYDTSDEVRKIILDRSAPPSPAPLTVRDASNQSVGPLLYIEWTALNPANVKDPGDNTDFAGYRIYRDNMSGCPTPSTFCELTLLTSITTKSYADTAVVGGTSYRYRIAAVDNIGNASDAVVTTTNAVTPNPNAGQPPQPPTITNARVVSYDWSSAVVKWDTGTTVSDSTVVIAERTSQPSDPQGVPDFSGFPSQGNSTLVGGEHTVNLVGLKAKTTYYLQVQSRAAGNTNPGVYPSSAAQVPLTFITDEIPPLERPVITPGSPLVESTARSATFRWTTDKAADSFVEYSLPGQPAILSGSRDNVSTAHVVTISGLEPGTSYSYRVRSTIPGKGESAYPKVSPEVQVSEPALTFSTKTEQTVDTTPPDPQNVTLATYDDTSATITWTTSELATHYVEFWTADDPTTKRTLPPSPGTATTQASVTINNLTPDTAYQYNALSIDAAGNAGRSAIRSDLRTRKDPRYTSKPRFVNTPPLRNDPATATTATIYFNTDQETQATVYYSIDSPTYNLSPQFFPLYQSGDHAATLVGLLPSQTYYYKVVITNPSGLTEESSDCGTGPNSCSFATAVQKGDLPAIKVDSIRVIKDANKANAVTIQWQTVSAANPSVLISTNSLVEFGYDVVDGRPQYGRTFGYVNDNVSSHSVVMPSDLLEAKTYYFRLYSTDSTGQIAVFPITADLNDTTCTNPNPAPLTCKNPVFTTIDTGLDPLSEVRTPPQITGVATLLVTDQRAVIGWTTDKSADSEVTWGLTTTYCDPTPGVCPKIDTLATKNHSVAIEGLAPNTTYYFKVASTDSRQQRQEKDRRDASDSAPSGVDCGIYFCFQTTAGTEAVKQSDYDALQATVSQLQSQILNIQQQLTNEELTAEERAALAAQLAELQQQLQASQASEAALAAQNASLQEQINQMNAQIAFLQAQIALVQEQLQNPELTPNEQAVLQQQLANLQAQLLLAQQQRDALQAERDALLQQISQLQNQISQIENQLASPGLSAADRARLEQELNSLQRQLEALQGQLEGQLRDSRGPSITAVTVLEIKDRSAVITWTTDEEANSLVQYGIDDAYGRAAGDAKTMELTHKVTLARLLPGTTYHFSVVSYDVDGNKGESDDATFKTTGTKTDEEEGDEKTSELDEATKRIKELSDEKKLSIERIIELLQEYGEEDVVKILSTIGVQLVSPPKFVGGVPRVEVTQTSATITWQTDKPSDSRVAFVPTDLYRPNRDEPYQTESGDTQDFTTDHKVTLLGLTPNTVYHYQLRSREAAGRTARSVDRTFKTLPLKPEVSNTVVAKTTENSATLTWKTNVPTKSVIEYVNTKTNEKRSQGDPQFVTSHQFTVSNLAADSAYTATVKAESEDGQLVSSGVIPFKTTRDNVAPEINQVRTDVTLSAGQSDVSQAIITWKTNEPATSQVFFEEGITQSPTLKNTSPLQEEMLLNHVVVLNKLRSATPYRFRVVSKDGAGNTTVSRDYTLLTPAKKQTVVEIIIKNFEDAFGFLKGFGE